MNIWKTQYNFFMKQKVFKLCLEDYVSRNNHFLTEVALKIGFGIDKFMENLICSLLFLSALFQFEGILIFSLPLIVKKASPEKKIILSMMYPEVFWAYHCLYNKWSWKDCTAPSSSILKC